MTPLASGTQVPPFILSSGSTSWSKMSALVPVIMSTFLLNTLSRAAHATSNYISLAGTCAHAYTELQGRQGDVVVILMAMSSAKIMAFVSVEIKEE